ncbi:angiopoietin-related protein 6-like [Clavelina lepadiformis]|uniref:angiopoietin-related protein 6-like n=1 Tax=Clavelina lepadiformis TaxID=159417 RepID=UPI004041082C
MAGRFSKGASMEVLTFEEIGIIIDLGLGKWMESFGLVLFFESRTYGNDESSLTGLEKIHRLTQSGECRLKIELWNFDDVYKYADYDQFSVDDEDNLFRLHIGSYSGTAGDSLTYHNNRPFSSRDRDNDSYSRNCVDYRGGGGGWWFGACRHSSLNALWGQSRVQNEMIYWTYWSNSMHIRSTKMKFRCDGN